MNEISCDICIDLIPLVEDGVASEDSRKAVEAHVANCESCREKYSGTVPQDFNTKYVFLEFTKKTASYDCIFNDD
ncbi:hypothetical protein EVA_09508, partial [gut metagenome]